MAPTERGISKGGNQKPWLSIWVANDGDCATWHKYTRLVEIVKNCTIALNPAMFV